jgi:hypothetical protein
MAVVYSQYAWSFVSSGVRTRIYAGPLWHGAPVQWVQFARVSPGLPSIPVSFLVTVYSAAPPWYLNNTGVGTAWRNFAIPVPSGSFSPFPRVDIQKVPWEAGFPVWAVASPWAEFFVTTNVTCMANLFVP